MPETLRLAFVGQRLYFHPVALHEPADGVAPSFVDLPAGGGHLVRAQLDALDPDVVVVFRPELLPAGALHGLRAVTVGYLTEPLPRPGRPSHPDLEQRLTYLRAADRQSFDRILTYDPHLAATVEPFLPVWRAQPLPVADTVFAPVRPAAEQPTFLFTGRPTAHRDAYLDPVKHGFDLVHLAHGITDERLAPFLAAADVGINLHNEPYANFENRVSTFLAAGLLVITETLSPRWALQPGVDHLEIQRPCELWELARLVVRTPGAFHGMRLSGRRRAERFRASRVWPALAREALADVAAFGSHRVPAPSVARLKADARPV